MVRTTSLFLPVLGVLALLAASLYLPSGIAKASETAVEEQAGESEPCQPVARIFEETICQSALQNEEAAAQNVPPALAGKQIPQPPRPAEEEQAAQTTALRQLIWQKALTHQFGAEALSPTAGEIARFRAEAKEVRQQQYEADQQTVALLETYLTQNTYREPYQSEAQELLALSRQSVAFFQKQQAHREAVPEYLAFISEKAEKTLAEQALRQWRQDKALFTRYGGQLAVAGDRLIPLEAYRAFYDELVESGALTIEDKRFNDLFSGFFDAPEKDMTYLPANDPLYKNYFTDPAAPFRIAKDTDRLSRLEAWLKSLPVETTKTSDPKQ